MSRKSLKRIHTKDRISHLPKAIILHILSFMDAKTAVRTGVLSRQFAYMWTEAPCLNFEQATMEFIYTTILYHKRLNLEKVSVVICYNDEKDWHRDLHQDHQYEFRRFIRLLSLASIKEIVLKPEGAYYTLPQHFYSNPFLKKLTLRHCHMIIDGFVDWKSLKSLSLGSMVLPDNTINDVLSGCPSLEFLELFSVFFPLESLNLSRICKCLLTNNKCLRKLVIDGCHVCHINGRGTFEIVAPNVQSLHISGCVKWFECRVLNAKSLTDCFLDFYGHNDEVTVIKMLISLLDDLSHVEVVTIGEWVLQVLFLIQRNKLPFPMSKAIKCLTIRTSLTEDDIAGIECLLQNLNHLETLSIELYDYEGEYFLPEYYGEDRGYWISKKMQSKVDLKLKNVRVCYLVVDEQFQYDMSEVLLLFKFLLKNANFMENLTISARGTDHYLLKLTNTLIEFPRSSPRAVVKIQDW